MRRYFVLRAGCRRFVIGLLALLLFTQTLTHQVTDAFQLIQALALPGHGLIKRVQPVFLKRQAGFKCFNALVKLSRR